MKNIIAVIVSLVIISCSHSEKENSAKPREIVIQDSLEDLCREKIVSVKIEKSVQKSNVDLTELYYEAKSHPIFFIEEPQYKNTDSKLIKSHRSRFEKANPWTFLISDTNKKYYKWRPEIGAEVFLRNGYFYHPDLVTAHAMTQLISLDMVVKEPLFLIQRGHLLMAVQKKNKAFFFKDGPYAGRVATLAFLDRIIVPDGGINGIIPKALHIDFTTAKDSYHFDTIMPKHISESHVVADVSYGTKVVETLFKREGVQITLDCETINTYLIRKSRSKRANGIALLKSAMMEQVLERVPFDEPKYEKGQEDGRLRDAWMRFFYMGRLKYQYKNERMVEENYIYDHMGKPIPPQVCVDFLVDSIDRTAGSWYTAVDSRRNPLKTNGFFNSSDLRYKDEDGKEQHYALRTIKGFTQFAKDYPNWFEIIDVNDDIKLGSLGFFDHIKNLNLQEGDMIFIKGSVPWDKKEEHSHSFYIYQNDPVTGIPILLAGNAGSASLRPWKIETNRTPNRSIRKIIRIKDEFLRFITTGKK